MQWQNQLNFSLKRQYFSICRETILNLEVLAPSLYGIVGKQKSLLSRKIKFRQNFENLSFFKIL